MKNGEGETIKYLCKVSVSIGKRYSDTVTCDVVDMDATHILLSRPWQYNVNATHHGKLNTYVFQGEGRKIALLPLPPESSCKKTINVDFLLQQKPDFMEELKNQEMGLALVIKELGKDSSDQKKFSLTSNLS